MDANQLLADLFDADLRAQAAEATLLAYDDSPTLEALLEQATDEALAMPDAHSAVARLVRLADLCAQVQGPKLADVLLRVLNHESPEVRVAAGEALRDFAYDRYAEVARAIERAFDREQRGPALAEVPWILAEIGEPSALPLVARCLKHPDVEVVASGIEALAELGDAQAVPLLEPLVDDARVVELQEGDAGYSTTLGELAQEAISDLSEG
jgi:HEAT repeat protein